MCKLMTIIKMNDNNDALLKELVENQRDLLDREPNGISALAIGKNDKIMIKKSLENYDSIINWAIKRIKNSKVISIHSRTATSGNVDKNNLHFFKVDDYYFAHNGIVGGLHSYECMGAGYLNKWYPVNTTANIDTTKKDEKKEVQTQLVEVLDSKGECKEIQTEKDKMCDSYQFLFNLPKPIKGCKAIEKYMEKESFGGAGLLVDAKKKRVFSLIGKTTPAHTNFKNYKIDKGKEFLGFDIEDKEDRVKIPRRVVKNGVYQFNY
jgi:hypothetical protein